MNALEDGANLDLDMIMELKEKSIKSAGLWELCIYSMYLIS